MRMVGEILSIRCFSLGKFELFLSKSREFELNWESRKRSFPLKTTHSIDDQLLEVVKSFSDYHDLTFNLLHFMNLLVRQWASSGASHDVGPSRQGA